MEIPVTAKPVSSSSTVWLNVATIAVLVLSAAALGLGDLGIDPLTQARVLYAINIANAGLNAWLRLRTHEPLAGTTGERKAIAEASAR